MPLPRTTPLVQLLLHIDTSWTSSRHLLLNTHFSAPHALYTHHSFCVPHPFISGPPSAATCEPMYLKQSTSSNGSQLEEGEVSHAKDPHYHISEKYHIHWTPLPYLEHFITLLLPALTLLYSFAYSTKLTHQSTQLFLRVRD